MAAENALEDRLSFVLHDAVRTFLVKFIAFIGRDVPHAGCRYRLIQHDGFPVRQMKSHFVVKRADDPVGKRLRTFLFSILHAQHLRIHVDKVTFPNGFEMVGSATAKAGADERQQSQLESPADRRGVQSVRHEKQCIACHRFRQVPRDKMSFLFKPTGTWFTMRNVFRQLGHAVFACG